MRHAAVVGVLVLLTGCTYYYYPAPATAPAEPASDTAAHAPASSDCREFTQTVVIGGQPRQATGHACPQPDGTWRIQ
jgi:hypothetical protein